LLTPNDGWVTRARRQPRLLGKADVGGVPPVLRVRRAAFFGSMSPLYG
jgi:hypothetical protein